jgi:hypothetical protein
VILILVAIRYSDFVEVLYQKSYRNGKAFPRSRLLKTGDSTLYNTIVEWLWSGRDRSGEVGNCISADI